MLQNTTFFFFQLFWEVSMMFSITLKHRRTEKSLLQWATFSPQVGMCNSRKFESSSQQVATIIYMLKMRKRNLTKNVLKLAPAYWPLNCTPGTERQRIPILAFHWGWHGAAARFPNLQLLQRRDARVPVARSDFNSSRPWPSFTVFYMWVSIAAASFCSPSRRSHAQSCLLMDIMTNARTLKFYAFFPPTVL